MGKRPPRRPEPAIVHADGTRSDAAEWRIILGDDRRPWDLTFADLIAMQAQRDLDNKG